MSDSLFEAFRLLEKTSADLLSQNLKNCVAQTDENGVVHLVNENGYSVAMMTQQDYKALVKYKGINEPLV